MFNTHHYLPKVICSHVSLSDLGVTLPHLFKFIVAQFCNTAHKLISNVQPYKQQHIGSFVSLALPQLWYPRWDSQAVARCARARLNGVLGQAALQAGSYIVNHPELTPNDFPAFIVPGMQELSSTGNLVFIADIQHGIQKADPTFHVPLALDYTAFN